ncbi:YicC/YloC family endoribonuclease [Steroidobacter cummioxidans]|uniref:YicC/YloC family endoribonuclease n=1 Tax=Steroidobacter cummioxidans TaxID=1803913 RepID=UPI001F4D8E90|nr:YicC/YloC family endoribonuclease [Steroidobacter cummioxidans]
MTGFARRERAGPWGTLVCELRTVNHRYLETSLRLPEELKTLDNEVRQAITAALRRGKVDANLYLKSAAGTQRSLELDTQLLDELVARVEQVRGQLKYPAPVSPIDVLRWPGVVREAEVDIKPVLAAALELVQEALNELNETRLREGQRIRELLLARCATMRTQVQAVRARLPEVSRRMRERIIERITQLGSTPDPERLEQELVLYAHKMDVDEELDRLGAHLEEVTSVLGSAEPAGRRLDFLMQELNREANTLSSKSQDSETTRAAVDMKVAIEQMREQVQNVE